MIAQMPKTCEGCKDRENKRFDISPCDRYSLGTHQECYDKMDKDDLEVLNEPKTNTKSNNIGSVRRVTKA